MSYNKTFPVGPERSHRDRPPLFSSFGGGTSINVFVCRIITKCINLNTLYSLTNINNNYPIIHIYIELKI